MPALAQVGEATAARPHGCRAPPVWRGRAGSVHGALMGHAPILLLQMLL
ncbi:hypothetical protein [Methanothrix sp.]